MNRHTGGYQGYTGYGTKDEEIARMMQKEASAAGVGPEVIGAPNYESMERESGLYQDMIGRGMDTSSTNFTGGLARLANAYLGRRGLNKLEKREGEAQEYEAAQAQKQSDKLKEMARMMAGPDATPEALAMAQFNPEGFMESSLDAQTEANKPRVLGREDVLVGGDGNEIARGLGPKPDYQKATIKDPKDPSRFVEVQYDPTDPQGTMQIIGEAEPTSAMVKVNVGDEVDRRPIVDKPPKGYQHVWDGSKWTQQPISGSPEEYDETMREVKGFTAINASREQWGTMRGTLDDAITYIDEGNAAGWAGLLSAMPESDARSLKNKITTIKGLIGFDKMREMQQNSPTGATGLGQITEKEIEFLQGVRGTIDQLDDPAVIREVLMDVRGSLERIHKVEELAYKIMYRIELSPEEAETLARYEREISGMALDNVVGMSLPDGSTVTEEDIQATMQANNMTRQQVIDALAGGGQ